MCNYVTVADAKYILTPNINLLLNSNPFTGTPSMYYNPGQEYIVYHCISQMTVYEYYNYLNSNTDIISFINSVIPLPEGIYNSYSPTPPSIPFRDIYNIYAYNGAGNYTNYIVSLPTTYNPYQMVGKTTNYIGYDILFSNIQSNINVLNATISISNIQVNNLQDLIINSFNQQAGQYLFGILDINDYIANFQYIKNIPYTLSNLTSQYLSNNNPTLLNSIQPLVSNINLTSSNPYIIIEREVPTEVTLTNSDGACPANLTCEDPDVMGQLLDFYNLGYLDSNNPQPITRILKGWTVNPYQCDYLVEYADSNGNSTQDSISFQIGQDIQSCQYYIGSNLGFGTGYFIMDKTPYVEDTYGTDISGFQYVGNALTDFLSTVTTTINPMIITASNAANEMYNAFAEARIMTYNAMGRLNILNTLSNCPLLDYNKFKELLFSNQRFVNTFFDSYPYIDSYMRQIIRFGITNFNTVEIVYYKDALDIDAEVYSTYTAGAIYSISVTPGYCDYTASFISDSTPIPPTQSNYLNFIYYYPTVTNNDYQYIIDDVNINNIYPILNINPTSKRTLSKIINYYIINSTQTYILNEYYTDNVNIYNISAYKIISDNIIEYCVNFCSLSKLNLSAYNFTFGYNNNITVTFSKVDTYFQDYNITNITISDYNISSDYILFNNPIITSNSIDFMLDMSTLFNNNILEIMDYTTPPNYSPINFADPNIQKLASIYNVAKYIEGNTNMCEYYINNPSELLPFSKSYIQVQYCYDNFFNPSSSNVDIIWVASATPSNSLFRWTPNPEDQSLMDLTRNYYNSNYTSINSNYSYSSFLGKIYSADLNNDNSLTYSASIFYINADNSYVLTELPNEYFFNNLLYFTVYFYKDTNPLDNIPTIITKMSITNSINGTIVSDSNAPITPHYNWFIQNLLYKSIIITPLGNDISYYTDYIYSTVGSHISSGNIIIDYGYYIPQISGLLTNDTSYEKNSDIYSYGWNNNSYLKTFQLTQLQLYKNNIPINLTNIHNIMYNNNLSNSTLLLEKNLFDPIFNRNFSEYIFENKYFFSNELTSNITIYQSNYNTLVGTTYYSNYDYIYYRTNITINFNQPTSIDGFSFLAGNDHTKTLQEWVIKGTIDGINWLTLHLQNSPYTNSNYPSRFYQTPIFIFGNNTSNYILPQPLIPPINLEECNPAINPSDVINMITENLVQNNINNFINLDNSNYEVFNFVDNSLNIEYYTEDYINNKFSYIVSYKYNFDVIVNNVQYSLSDNNNFLLFYDITFFNLPETNDCSTINSNIQLNYSNTNKYLNIQYSNISNILSTQFSNYSNYNASSNWINFDIFNFNYSNYLNLLRYNMSNCSEDSFNIMINLTTDPSYVSIPSSVYYIVSRNFPSQILEDVPGFPERGLNYALNIFGPIYKVIDKRDTYNLIYNFIVIFDYHDITVPYDAGVAFSNYYYDANRVYAELQCIVYDIRNCSNIGYNINFVSLINTNDIINYMLSNNYIANSNDYIPPTLENCSGNSNMNVYLNFPGDEGTPLYNLIYDSFTSGASLLHYVDSITSNNANIYFTYIDYISSNIYVYLTSTYEMSVNDYINGNIVTTYQPYNYQLQVTIPIEYVFVDCSIAQGYSSINLISFADILAFYIANSNNVVIGNTSLYNIIPLPEICPDITLLNQYQSSTISPSFLFTQYFTDIYYVTHPPNILKYATNTFTNMVLKNLTDNTRNTTNDAIIYYNLVIQSDSANWANSVTSNISNISSKLSGNAVNAIRLLTNIMPNWNSNSIVLSFMNSAIFNNIPIPTNQLDFYALIIYISWFKLNINYDNPVIETIKYFKIIMNSTNSYINIINKYSVNLYPNIYSPPYYPLGTDYYIEIQLNIINSTGLCADNTYNIETNYLNNITFSNLSNYASSNGYTIYSPAESCATTGPTGTICKTILNPPNYISNYNAICSANIISAATNTFNITFSNGFFNILSQYPSNPSITIPTLTLLNKMFPTLLLDTNVINYIKDNLAVNVTIEYGFNTNPTTTNDYLATLFFASSLGTSYITINETLLYYKITSSNINIINKYTTAVSYGLTNINNLLWYLPLPSSTSCSSYNPIAITFITTISNLDQYVIQNNFTEFINNSVETYTNYDTLQTFTNFMPYILPNKNKKIIKPSKIYDTYICSYISLEFNNNSRIENLQIFDNSEKIVKYIIYKNEDKKYIIGFNKSNIILGYTFTTNFISSDYDPHSWTLKGSTDGKLWTSLDSRKLNNKLSRGHQMPLMYLNGDTKELPQPQSLIEDTPLHIQISTKQEETSIDKNIFIKYYKQKINPSMTIQPKKYIKDSNTYYVLYDEYDLNKNLVGRDFIVGFVMNGDKIKKVILYEDNTDSGNMKPFDLKKKHMKTYWDSHVMLPLLFQDF